MNERFTFSVRLDSWRSLRFLASLRETNIGNRQMVFRAKPQRTAKDAKKTRRTLNLEREAISFSLLGIAHPESGQRSVRKSWKTSIAAIIYATIWFSRSWHGIWFAVRKATKIGDERRDETSTPGRCGVVTPRPKCPRSSASSAVKINSTAEVTKARREGDYGNSVSRADLRFAAFD